MSPPARQTKRGRSDPKGNFVYHILMKLKLFFLSILVLILFVAYQKYTEYSSLKSINSYDSCITAKGSIIQESYPATCITRLSTRFTQPIFTQKYFNSIYGFSFEYPSNFVLSDSAEKESMHKDIVFRFELKDDDNTLPNYPKTRDSVRGTIYASKLDTLKWVNLSKKDGNLPTTLVLIDAININLSLIHI